MGVYSCGDNDDFSSQHVLTDAELAEMHRQDSIDSVNRSKIDADLVLEYTVEAFPATGWESVQLDIDLDKIGECFGLTADEVAAGILEGSDIKGFAIQGSTHADYGTASTTNGPWGHWFDLNGDAGTYADYSSLGTIRFYCEWQEGGYFLIGQFPSKCVGGDTFTAIEGLSYQGKRVAVKITYNIKTIADEETAPSGDPTTITKDIVMENDWNDSYTMVQYDIKEDLRQAFKMTTKTICDAIEAGEVKLYINDVTEEDPTYTADSPGYWLTKDGESTTWGSDSWIYISLGRSAADAQLYLYGSNHPNYGREGGDIHVKYVITHTNGGKAIYNITYKLNPFVYVDPESKPGTTPANITKDITLSKAWSDDYAQDVVDVKTDICNAFNMTTYELSEALRTNELKVYINNVTDELTYTGGDNGEWWIDENGSTEYATGKLFTGLYIDYTEKTIIIGMGNHLENCPKTFSTTYKMIITDGKTTATYNVTANIQ